MNATGKQHEIIKQIFVFNSSQSYPGRLIQALGVCQGISRAPSVAKMTSNQGPKIETFFFIFDSETQIGYHQVKASSILMVPSSKTATKWQNT